MPKMDVVVRQLLIVLLGAWSALAAAAQSPDYTALDERYQVVANDFYRAWLQKQPPAQSETLAELRAALAAAEPVPAGALVRAHQKLLQAEHQSPVFRAALTASYALGDTAQVRALTDFIKTSGDPVAVAENQLTLAQYFAARGQWAASSAVLAQLDARLLSIANAHYATMLRAYALQATKKHRQALALYAELPKSSAYYAELQLNQGIAYLRQGWWTDAHEALKAALAQAPKDSDLASRARVALGFSQLHHEFYRDARETLRGVALDSPYANKALLGIGVAAVYEEDFAGAENAFQRLIESPATDANIDEAHLLLGQARLERGASAAAAAAFESAIKYFEGRIAELDRAASQLAQAPVGGALELYQQIDAQAPRLLADSPAVPRYLRDNYRNLMSMMEISTRERLQVELAGLVNDYDQALCQALASSVGARRAVLHSYLSQAKLGVAKLYDAP